MTADPPDNVPLRPPTAELRLCLEQLLAAHYGEPVKVADLQRQPWEYRSSFALESLRLDLGPRGTLTVMFKDLGWHALTAEAQRAKPRELYDPLREIRCYEEILRFQTGYGPTCYGAVVDKVRARYWLFIEQIQGQELYQVGDFAVWECVARWLAGMHAALQPLVAANVELQQRLIKHNVPQQEQWFSRACRAVRERTGAASVRQLDELSNLLPGMARALAVRPPALIHGELYPSNILIVESEDGPRVRAVDWEMAGLGCELLDLAALVAGRWTAEQQRALAMAYYESARAAGGKWPDEQRFFETLDYCRLYIALAWLGWSDDWSPPPPHAHDWLSEALSAGDRLAQRLSSCK